LHEHKQSLNRIQEHLLPLARHWNQTSLTLNATVLSVLSGIGGVLGYYKDCIAVPCFVNCASGQQHEKAVVLVIKHPPHQWYETGMVHWSDEIAAVTASPYALPLDVRKASAEKQEVSMGFAPVGIVDNQGKEYTLPCEGRFFDYSGVKGEEIRLSGRKEKWRERVIPAPAQAFYFVDWFDGCEGMLLASESA
jgi:hypothetical protein